MFLCLVVRRHFFPPDSADGSVADCHTGALLNALRPREEKQASEGDGLVFPLLRDEGSSAE